MKPISTKPTSTPGTSTRSAYTRSANALAALALALSLLSTAIHAARPLQPPSLEFSREQNLVIAGVATYKRDADHVVFQRTAALLGQAPESIGLRMDADTFADVVVGQPYILAYSHIKDHPRIPEAKIVDPEGPRVLKVKGFGTRALFDDNEALRLLFGTARTDKAPQPEQLLSLLIPQMQSSDQRTQVLGVVEFYLRPELHVIVRGPEEEAIVDLIARDDLHTQLRIYLLEAALHFPDPQSRSWLTATHREIIDRAGIQFDLGGFQPALVRTSAQALATLGDESDIPRLTKLLRSNAPGVVEATLDTLDGLARNATVEQVITILQDESPSGPTKRVLETYVLRRLASTTEARFPDM